MDLVSLFGAADGERTSTGRRRRTRHVHWEHGRVLAVDIQRALCTPLHR